MRCAPICGGRTRKFIPVSTPRPTQPAQPARPAKDTILTSRQSKTPAREGARDLRATKATLSKHARNYAQRGIICDLPTMGGQLKRPLVITRPSNVIACFSLLCPRSGTTQCHWPRARRGSYLSPPTQVQSHAAVPP